jgi:uncharacterized protein
MNPSLHHHASPLLEFGSRLVRLPDGRTGLRGGLQVEVQAHGGPAAAPIIDFIASSGALDRFQEIIEPGGWRLEHYRRNPVFQNAHQYGDIIFTLGKALITEVRVIGSRRALFQRVEFATEANPMARIAYGLYRGGFLRAVSVGFIPLRWENGPAQPSEGQAYRRRYLEQELLEVSAVGIPANPEALALGLRSGAVEKADIRRLLDLLGSREDQAERTDLTDPPTPENAAPILQLVRELRRVLGGCSGRRDARPLRQAGRLPLR